MNKLILAGAAISVAAQFQGAFAADWEVAVPSGQTMTLAQATAGIDASTLAGKRLVKTGAGVFALSASGARRFEVPAEFRDGALCFTASVRGEDGNAVLEYEIIRE